MDKVLQNVNEALKQACAPVNSTKPIPTPDTDADADADAAKKCLENVEDKLSKINSQDTFSYVSVCIYKVPDNYRKKNEKAYTPTLVSVGFIHHGDNQVQPMEEYKIKYLKNFIDIFEVSMKELVKYVVGQQKFVCRFYEDTYIRSLPEDKVPSEVILLDGVFVVELFLKNYFVELREKGDLIFDNIWVYNGILHDMLLFENQLPFKFLHSLYEKFVFKKLGKWLDNCTFRPPSFDELAHKYFKDVGKLRLRPDCLHNARHFVEFLSILHKPYDKHHHNQMHRVERGVKFAHCPTATQLKAVGVKFEPAGTANRVQFNNKDGVLKIPALTLNDSTETFYRNVIAFEQSGYHSKYTTSMVIFLDNLIEDARDVDLLVERRIINNVLGCSDQVADLFNTIYTESVPDSKEFYFVEECKQLNEYSRDWWHKAIAVTSKWLADLGNKYFSNPWSFISLIAAIIALGLTAIQTAFAVYPSS